MKSCVKLKDTDDISSSRNFVNLEKGVQYSV
ncbi:hypothetical protein PSI9734_02255 [Pseudidiomarina piscicola]|uniref:Uncharacterized protein n=1 Tax=Pseudidiomarina piscicola TaxID=2614830 RepID=A0A6S6WRI3_9GAMM|nr:hypothetical protein PSI9734_02255 [Pseudidiomarina piscicola]VZT41340.1 hypothetical protein PSI9734_02255 [Pseudomonas aeruginosa]